MIFLPKIFPRAKHLSAPAFINLQQSITTVNDGVKIPLGSRPRPVIKRFYHDSPSHHKTPRSIKINQFVRVKIKCESRKVHKEWGGTLCRRLRFGYTIPSWPPDVLCSNTDSLSSCCCVTPFLNRPFKAVAWRNRFVMHTVFCGSGKKGVLITLQKWFWIMYCNRSFSYFSLLFKDIRVLHSLLPTKLCHTPIFWCTCMYVHRSSPLVSAAKNCFQERKGEQCRWLHRYLNGSLTWKLLRWWFYISSREDAHIHSHHQVLQYYEVCHYRQFFKWTYIFAVFPCILVGTGYWTS